MSVAAVPPGSSPGSPEAAGPRMAADAVTYYGRPLLKKPEWDTEVIAYLFLGGVMGGSGVLSALADERPDGVDVALGRSARYASFVLAAICPIVLIGHLGRPERFLNMLRIVKFKSVMSMGVWGLIAFSAPAGAAAAGQLSRDGLLPGWIARAAPRALTDPLVALFGAFIAGYTGVLLSATAVPLWAIGKRHIPAFSVCSGIAGACALHGGILALANAGHASERKLERLERVASVAEALLLLDFARHAGDIAAPMFSGSRGVRLRVATLFGGIVLPQLLHAWPGRPRLARVAAAALTLVGGYVLRETLVEAGKDSADDPRHASRQPV